MPSATQLRLPPIADPDLFEELCCDLWSRIWGDPNTQRHGRKGQKQQGVDVVGMPGQRGEFAGIQCKAVLVPLTDEEFRHEVEDAKGFKPPLKELIIASTAPKDAKLEQLAREIAQEHRTRGLFRVVMKSWGDILRLLSPHPDLVEQYFQVSSQASALTAIVTAAEERVTTTITDAADSLRQPLSQLNLLVELSSQEHYHQELNYVRDLLNGFKPKQGLEYLAKCRERLWHTAQPPLRYRILHYEGCAAYLLGRGLEAGGKFLEALQYNPADITALVYSALGHLLSRDREQAAVRIKEILEHHPGDGQAYAVLLLSAPENASVADLLDQVPERYRSLPVVAHALAHLAQQKHALDDAERFVRAGIECDQENWPRLRGQLGCILLERATAGISNLAQFLLTDERRVLLGEAIAALTTAWERLGSSEVAVTELHLLVNRAMAHQLLGEYEKAADDLDQALRMRPDDLILVERRGVLANQQGDVAMAIRILRRALPCPSHPSIYFALVDFLGQNRRYSEVDEVMEQLLALEPGAAHPDEARRVQIEAAVAQGDFPRAHTICQVMRTQNPAGASGLLAAAKLARLEGSTEESAELLRQAQANLSDHAQLSDHYLLAAEWYALREYGQAARCWEQIGQTTRDIVTEHSLLLAYYHAGELGAALDVAKRLLRENGPTPEVSEIAAAILEEIGDLPAARAVVQDYLATFPDEFAMRLRLANISLRLRERDAVDHFLDSPIDAASLTLEQGEKVAQLCAYRGRVEQAMSVAYEVTRRHWDESRAQAHYITLVIDLSHGQGEHSLGPDTVALDTAAQIRNEAGQERWYIIESRPQPHPIGTGLLPSHPLAQELLNKKVGTTIVLRQNQFSTEHGVISAIQSKYGRMLQECLDNFETLFPGDHGLRGFKLGLDSVDGESPGEQPFFRWMEQRREHVEAVEQFYKEGRLPLAALSRMTGQNVIATWARLTDQPELGIRCSSGSLGDLQAAQSLLQSTPRLIVELISLLTLYSLDCCDALVRHVGTLGIAQSTVDLLHELMEEGKRLELGGCDGDDGQALTSESEVGDVGWNLAYLQKLMTWVDEHCQILPVTAALRRERKWREELAVAMHPSFIDTLLLADEPGTALYSDDERLRALAWTELGHRGVWTQPVMDVARAKGVISRQGYNNAIVKLLRRHYQVVHVNAEVVVEAARQAHWKPAHPYTTALQLLPSVKCEDAAAYKVGGEAISILYREALLPLQRDILIHRLLDAVATQRDPLLVVRGVVAAAAPGLRLMPLQQDQFRDVLQAWIATRSI